MPTIAEAVTANLDRLTAREQRGRQATAPAQYERADFQRIPGKAGRYLNRQTGESVSRRQHDRLIGRPLPPRTKAQARARVARQIRERGVRVQRFSGIVRQPSGRDRRQQRDRQMRGDTDIEGGTLDGMLAAWERGLAEAAGDGFNDAFLAAWWNGGSGLIADVDELAFDVREEE